MQNSISNPRNFEEFDKSNMIKFAIGFSATATKSASTNIDYALTDDLMMAGGHSVLVKDAAWGDTLTLQILSPLGAVLFEVWKNWPINPQEYKQVLPIAHYSPKLVAGLTIRSIYNSVGAANDVSIMGGYNFEKLIV